MSEYGRCDICGKKTFRYRYGMRVGAVRRN